MALRLEDLDPAVLAQAAGDWGEQSPVEPLPGYFQDDPEEWLRRHNRFCARSQEGGVRALFLGDSITEGWGAEGLESWNRYFAHLPAVNYGIGGDRTQQLLWRLEQGNLEGIRPELVVLKIGVNNLWSLNKTSDEVAEGIEAVVALLQEKIPGVKILLQGILPTGELPDSPFRPLITEINARISRLHDGEKVVFLDLGRLFLEEDGSISAEVMPDFCHLSPAAYERWAASLSPVVQSMLAS